MRVTTAPRGQEVALVKRKRHTPEQIIRKLREAEGLLEQGTELPEVMRRLEISVQTYHRWKAQHRSTQRRRPSIVPADEHLRKRLRALSGEHQKWGYRKQHTLLCREGLRINRKRVRRIWREEGLQVRRRKRRRRAGSRVPGHLAATHPNHTWAMDYEFDE